jgi:predicted phosphodiesterase
MKPKKILAVSCSHGLSLDPAARHAVMCLRDQIKPEIVLHLGDWMDTAAFMRSAGESERGQSVIEDCAAGVDFLTDLRPTVLFCGNHDDRLWKEADHPNTMRRDLARLVIEKIEAFCATISARLIQYTGALNATGWLKIGPCVFGHGVMFGENAARDHAEAFAGQGKYVIFGHTHRIIVQAGRTMGETMGYSIGCLCNKPAMEYAKNRRQTMAWQHAALIGEIGEDGACLSVSQLGTSEPEPIQEMTW